MNALVLVYGDVHGVGFRSYCKRLAQQLNLSGLCRNERDGGVKVFLDGEAKQIEKFVEAIKAVKPGAFFGPQVDKVAVFKEGDKNFQLAWRDYVGFEITF